METTEAGALLVKIQAYDRRTVGRGDIEAWADAMSRADVRLQDALEAVSRHFSESSDWLMPIHVIRLVAQIRKVRFDHAPVKVIPRDLHQAVERTWIHAFNRAVGDGHPDPNAAADQSMGFTRPAELDVPRDLSTLHVGQDV